MSLQESLDHGGVPCICSECQRIFFGKWRLTGECVFVPDNNSYKVPEEEKVALMLKREPQDAPKGKTVCKRCLFVGQMEKFKKDAGMKWTYKQE